MTTRHQGVTAVRRNLFSADDADLELNLKTRHGVHEMCRSATAFLPRDAMLARYMLSSVYQT